MGLKGKVTAEVEMRSPADKLYKIFASKTHHLSNVTDKIHDVHMHEGDWGTHGSHRNWTYVADGKVEKCREKTSFDDKNRTMTAELVEGDPLKLYKNFVGILTVDPKDQGCLVKWTVDFEKLDPDVPEPFHYLETALKVSRDLDADLLKT